MKTTKIRRFVVLQVTSNTSEKPGILHTFLGLQKLGLAINKIMRKEDGCLKLRIWIDPLRQIGQELVPRNQAVGAVLGKVEAYFTEAVVAVTYRT